MLTTAASAFALSLLIVGHELGHLVVAKLSGIKVLKFSLGLGPKLLGFKIGDTEWILSWIPFGGYVKLAGMEAGEIKGEGCEFYSKRLSIRTLVIVAGPFFNLLLSVLILSLVFWTTGIEVEKTARVGRVEAGSPAFEAGIEKGDEILSVEGEAISTWGEGIQSMVKVKGGPVKLEVLRNGSRRELVLTPRREEGGLAIGLEPWIEPVVGGVRRGSAAEMLGVKVGDRIVAVGEKEIEQWYDLVEVVGLNPGVLLSIVWQRGGETFVDSVAPQVVTDMSVDGEPRRVGRLGILRRIEVRKLSSLASLGEGIRGAARMTRDIFLSFVRMFRGEVSPRTLGGIVSVVMLTRESASWGMSWLFGLIAVLSVNLFIINLFPLPPLDGGNLVLVCVEGMKRSRVSERQRLIVQEVGIALLIILAIYVTRNDVNRWFLR